MSESLSWHELSQLAELLQMVEKERIIFGEPHRSLEPSPNEDRVAQIVALDLHKKLNEAGITDLDEQSRFFDELRYLFNNVVLEITDKPLTDNDVPVDTDHPVISKFVFESSQDAEDPEAWSNLTIKFLKHIPLASNSLARFTWYFNSFIFNELNK